jgi:hypothetical protein
MTDLRREDFEQEPYKEEEIDVVDREIYVEECEGFSGEIHIFWISEDGDLVELTDEPEYMLRYYARKADKHSLLCGRCADCTNAECFRSPVYKDN